MSDMNTKPVFDPETETDTEYWYRKLQESRAESRAEYRRQRKGERLWLAAILLSSVVAGLVVTWVWL